MLDEELVQFHLELEGDIVKPYHRDVHQKTKLAVDSRVPRLLPSGSAWVSLRSLRVCDAMLEAGRGQELLR